MKCGNKNPKKNRNTNPKIINFTYLQVVKITLKHQEMWSSRMTLHEMEIWRLGVAAALGRRK